MNNKTAKKTKMTVGAVAGIALVSAGSLFAGNYDDKHASDSHKKKAMTAMTARSLEGMDLNLKSGEAAGVIDNFVFSTETGEIEGLAVGTGFLGLGGSEHYIGYEHLAISDYDRYNLSTTLSMKELEKYPRLKQGSLETSRDAETDIRSGHFAAMDLVGSDVHGANGAVHGDVHDWIVDVQTGEVPYVIVRRTEPFPSMSKYGYDFFAVSSDTIRGVRDGGLVVSATSDDFASAERIDDSSALRDAEDGTVHSFRYDGSMAQASL